MDILVIFFPKYWQKCHSRRHPPGGCQNLGKILLLPRHPPGGCLVPWWLAPKIHIFFFLKKCKIYQISPRFGHRFCIFFSRKCCYPACKFIIIGHQIWMKKRIKTQPATCLFQKKPVVLKMAKTCCLVFFETPEKQLQNRGFTGFLQIEDLQAQNCFQIPHHSSWNQQNDSLEWARNVKRTIFVMCEGYKNGSLNLLNAKSERIESIYGLMFVPSWIFCGCIFGSFFVGHFCVVSFLRFASAKRGTTCKASWMIIWQVLLPFLLPSILSSFGRIFRPFLPSFSSLFWVDVKIRVSNLRALKGPRRLKKIGHFAPFPT